MFRFIIRMFQKLLAKDWSKIIVNWIWIYQYVKKYWLQIIIYTGLNLFGTVFGLAGSVVSKNLIDAVTGFNTQSIGWAFAMYIGLGISRVFINIVTGKISLLIQTKVSNEIRADIFDQETFQNVQSIKAFGLIDQFSQKMRQIQTDALDLSLRQYRYQSWSSIIMSLTALAVSYACYGFAVYRLWQGDISYGTMTLFISMASSLSGSFSSVVSLIPTAIRAATSAERVMDIISLPRESYKDLKAAEKIRERGLKQGTFIQMQDVDFFYKDGRPVYKGACLTANPGEIVALIGPSGQGKTTTLRLLLGLIQPGKGKLRVGNPGEAGLEVSPSTRCLFSYVPQGNTMFYGTIAENLRMVKPEASDEELQEALEAAHAWNFVSRLEKGMDTIVGERGLGFSEGQNQRLSIARALLADAPILLLDEATSALDVATERRVLRSIMKKDPHRTIIVTAHRPSVFSMCSRVYKIEDETVQEVDEQGIQQFLEAF